MAIITLDPTTGPLDAATALELAPRPATLRGQVLGIIANGLGDSEIMFDALADALVEHDGVVDVVKIVKAGVAVAPYPEQWERVTSTATVAVTGFGGCGSCSTRSMRDALDLEAAGVPAVCLVHTALIPAVKAMARIAGAPDYPMIVIDYPHNPTAVWTKDEARELAEQVVDAVRARLTQQRANHHGPGSPSTLTSDAHSFDTVDDAVEYYFEVGWTDGLPIVPPTPERVQTMLAAAAIEPDVELGGVPTRNVVVTAEKAAVNAVMAGCRPDYFPVVVAAVRAFLQPEANAHSTTATLAGAAHAVIVNGPVRNDLEIESGQACFGPGFRANATIGRALRLVIRNACRAVPGVLDRASFSWPLRYSFCFGEHEEGSDWTPLHVQLGYAPEQSVVTIQSILHFFPVTEFEPEPAEILDAVVAMARYRGMMRDEWAGDGRSIVLVIGEEHQRRLIDGGHTKTSIQDYLWPLMTAEDVSKTDKKLNLAAPENIMVVAAGGPGLAQSWILAPHLSCPTSEVVTPA